MYYYGGYPSFSGSCGFPSCGCNYRGYGNSAAIILVLFILLVIVIGSKLVVS